ncbi:MAG TPA: ComF family protein [Gammaproteobacteria bacterium]|nr:ComF family protein [Gammaproteobacteria bacterium]
MPNIWIQTLKNLFLPEFCRECGVRLLTEENGFFCPTCWEFSPRIERPFCIRCGQPHRERIGFGETHNFPCKYCRETKAPAYTRIFAPALFDGPVAEAIRLLKFNGKRRLARPLGERMDAFARQELDCETYDAVVPVPLHKVRLRHRGFNQAALLAPEIWPAFPNATLDESLLRIRPTRVQSRLANEKERTANVVGAFAVPRQSSFDRKKILLIDDVVTTGETVAECAAALRRAGAKRVDILCAALPARAPAK